MTACSLYNSDVKNYITKKTLCNITHTDKTCKNQITPATIPVHFLLVISFKVIYQNCNSNAHFNLQDVLKVMIPTR